MNHVECKVDVRLPAGLGQGWHGRGNKVSINGNGIGEDVVSGALSRSAVLA